MTAASTPGKTPDGNLIYPPWHNLLNLGTRPATAKLVDPDFGFNEQLYAMVWGAIYFPTNWSQSWINDARITALASDQITWPANETYAFFNPKTGITYRSHGIGTETVFGNVHQRGVGARMLEWANKLVFLSYVVVLDVNGNPVLNADGTPKLVLNAQGHAQVDPDYASTAIALEKYVDNIDIFRQLTSTFSRDLGDGSLPLP